MVSKAAHRARRRARAMNAAWSKIIGPPGRPRDEGVVRYDSGRKDRRATETMADTMATVIHARMRRHGMDADGARRKDSGYSLGRLYIAGVLRGKPGQPSAEMMLEAGNRAAEDYLRYYAATGIAPPYPRAVDFNRVGGIGGEPRQDVITQAANRFMGLEGALGIADVQGRPVTGLTKRVILGDESTDNWSPSMLAHLLRGLRSLVSFYGLG